MMLEVRDERLRDIIDENSELERLGSGFDFTEGPIWHHVDQHLIFSDMPGDHMRRWKPDCEIITFRQPSHKANGNAYDRSGRIVTCEHATSRVTRTEADGSITVLASKYDGKELNSPNDVIVKSDGGIYFTDPTYGRLEYYGVPRDTELDFQGVYRIDGGGDSLTLLVDDFAQPNGLCFTPDETRLFVNDTEAGHIRVFEVTDRGGLSGGNVWAEVTGDGNGAPDGLKVDAEGHVYCCGPGGIHVFAHDSTSLGVIRVPEVAANFCWGDADMKSIFITASSSLYRARTKIPGLILF
jgi:gluconolactonase